MTGSNLARARRRFHSLPETVQFWLINGWCGVRIIGNLAMAWVAFSPDYNPWLRALIVVSLVLYPIGQALSDTSELLVNLRLRIYAREAVERLMANRDLYNAFTTKD